MKKNPLLRRLLALLLVMQMVLLPVFATETDETSDGQYETAASDGSTDPSGSETQASDINVIPENVSGNASVNNGCKSINANVALINAAELQVDAGAALMYELNTDTLLYAFNADQKMYPASVTKVMTCLVALENGNLDDIVTVSKAVVANRDPYGSGAALQAGEQLSLKELLFCLMIASANDAASAISEYIAGSETAFVEMMNEKAQELGCTGTHFANPHGLHDENHYTTARDLAKIMMAALEYDTFQEIYSTRSHTVPATNLSTSRYLLSTNYMIEKSVVDYYYDERVIGGKTGFTTPAGRCLMAVSQSGDMKLLTVVLGGASSTNEYGAVIYGSFESTGDMIDYGFGNYTAAQILSADAVLTEFPVSGGENNTQAVVKKAVGTAVPVDLNSSQLRYEYILDNGTLTAPIEAGEALGIVRIWYQSKCIAQEEIYATVASKVKETQPSNDPAVQNAAVQGDSDIWQIVLIIVLILLVLVVMMLVISYIRASIIRAKRAKRRLARRKNTGTGTARANDRNSDRRRRR